jgi:hypothetical protein
MYRAICIIFVGLFFILPSFSHAQMLGGPGEFQIILSPEYPRPFDSVVARLESSYFNLSGASVEFFVDGVEIDTQDGKRVQFTVGGAGSRTTLTVKLTAEGAVYTQELQIYPAEVSLILEPQSSTPPFYEGAKLLPSEGLVRLVALPNLRKVGGELIPASELVYEWKLGSRNLNDYSGIGRSVLTAIAPVQYRNADIVLTVRDQNNSVAAQTRMPITPLEPYIRAYRKDPLMGVMLNDSIEGNYTLRSEEETFTAVPFFFTNTPSISWNVGGNQSAGEDITVRREGTAEGRASVSVSAIDLTKNQAVSNNFTILFERLTTNLFGL